MRKSIRLQLVMAMVIVLVTPVLAETPQEKGLAIAQEIDRRDQGWQDSISVMRMVLRNKQGEESHRAVRINSLEVNGDGDKSLTIFDEPHDVKGTAFLSFSHFIEPDDQWLFMPALKRVKRISSANKSGPFMGSQFAYEDISSFEVDKYRYEYLRDEELEGIDTFVVTLYPNYEHSGYTQQIIWVDKQRYIRLKTEFYDRKNDLLKTLKYSNYTQYLNKYWRALEQFMTNHQNGKTTHLTWYEYRLRTGLSEQDFDRNSLKRVR